MQVDINRYGLRYKWIFDRYLTEIFILETDTCWIFILEISIKSLSDICQTSVKHLWNIYPACPRCTLQRIVIGIRCTCALVNEGQCSSIPKYVVGQMLDRKLHLTKKSTKFLTSVYPISIKYLSNIYQATAYQTSIQQIYDVPFRYTLYPSTYTNRYTMYVCPRVMLIYSKFCTWTDLG